MLGSIVGLLLSLAKLHSELFFHRNPSPNNLFSLVNLLTFFIIEQSLHFIR